MVGPDLLAATGHIQHQLEQFPAHLLDGLFAGRDGSGVQIDQIVPAFRCLSASRPLSEIAQQKVARDPMSLWLS